MAKYNIGSMVVFGLAVLIVSMWCMKGSEAGGVNEEGGNPIHAVRREDPPEGCGSKQHHTEGGDAEECTDEDDSLGLYSDIDDTFKAAARKTASHLHHHHHQQHHHDENDDSPDLAHNNVNVLGH